MGQDLERGRAAHEATRRHLVERERQVSVLQTEQAVLRDQRDREEELRKSTAQVGRDLDKWIVMSVDETNRSAHYAQRAHDPFAPEHGGFKGQACTEILDAFRKNQA